MSSEAWMMNREGRKAARRAAQAASTLRTGGMHATDVTVLDLSETGIRIATPVSLDIGQEISIGLAGVGARSANVAWVRNGQYGCAFAEKLAPEEVTLAFSTASVVPIGFVSRARAPAVPSAGLDHVYAGHRGWALPWDALVAGVLFLGLFAVVLRMAIRA